MAHRLRNLMTTLSLLPPLAAAVLWVRSHWGADVLARTST
jgi:hypothetical protein